MNRIGNELCLFKQNLFSEAMLKYHTSFIFYFCDADISIETRFIPTYQCSFLALVRKKKIDHVGFELTAKGFRDHFSRYLNKHNQLTKSQEIFIQQPLH